MTVIGILFEKRIVDDLGFPRTPNRPIELLGTHERYSRSVKTMIGAHGPDFLGGSATRWLPCGASQPYLQAAWAPRSRIDALSTRKLKKVPSP